MSFCTSKSNLGSYLRHTRIRLCKAGFTESEARGLFARGTAHSLRHGKKGLADFDDFTFG